MLLGVASARWESGFVGFACVGTEWEQSEQNCKPVSNICLMDLLV